MASHQLSKANFTPHEVASLLGVHHNTIKNWIRRGDIHAFTTVGGHFRVPRREVARLVTERGLPVPRELADAAGVVYVVAADRKPAQTLGKELGPSWHLCSFTDPFEAVMAMGRISPDLLVWDLGLPGVDVAALARRVRQDPALRRVKVLALGDELREGRGAGDPALDAVLPRNAPAGELARAARGLLPATH